MQNTTFDNSVGNFSPNVTRFGMLIDIVDIDKSHVSIVMKTILARNYEFLSYQNMCIYKIAWHSVNAIARVLNHISLERTGHQHSPNVYGVCITSLGVEL